MNGDVDFPALTTEVMKFTSVNEKVNKRSSCFICVSFQSLWLFLLSLHVSRGKLPFNHAMPARIQHRKIMGWIFHRFMHLEYSDLAKAVQQFTYGCSGRSLLRDILFLLRKGDALA